MNSKLGSRIATLSILLATGTLLTGCAMPMDRDQSGSSSTETSQETAPEFSAADLMFAQMMIPHHQQAVDMGTLAEALASSQEVKDLAVAIAGEQDAEILLMQSWLDKANVSMEMHHSMPMPGMLTEADMAELMDTRGAEFDSLFLELMIAHHEGAIDMAKTVLDSKNPEVKALAEAIVKTQAEQIDYMKQLQNQ